MSERTVVIDAGAGKSIDVPISFDGERLSAQLNIDGIPYHLERIHKSVLGSEYIVDNDPDYVPKSDSEGFCYIIAPFSE